MNRFWILVLAFVLFIALALYNRRRKI